MCTTSNRINGRFASNYLAFERSLARAGLPFHTHVEGTKWSWKRKVEWELEMCQMYPDDWFVFTDAFDYLYVGDLTETIEIVTSQPLMFPADRRIWPLERLASDYDKRRATTPAGWDFVNGAGPSGQGRAISSAIEYGLSTFDMNELARATDQLFWTGVYLAGYGVLDQRCVLTQTLYDVQAGELGVRGGRLTNFLTGSRPQFIHATGRSWVMIPNALIPSEEEVVPWV